MAAGRASAGSSLTPGDVEPCRAAEDPTLVADVGRGKADAGQFEERRQRRVRDLLACDVCARADVRPSGERDMADRRPAQVEAIRVLPVALVAVGGGDEDADPAPRG